LTEDEERAINRLSNNSLRIEAGSQARFPADYTAIAGMTMEGNGTMSL
jgi:hypothetical protein